MKALTLAALSLIATAAVAQEAPQTPPCAPRAQIAEGLAQKYREVPVARGLTSEGLMIEVFASEGGGFTVLMNRPDGISCIMAGGESWEMREIPKGKPAAY